jgi:hypothetical protein
MIDEGARFALHQRLSEVLGEEAAVTLMSHLPPSGWADVATRHHVDAVRRDVDALRGEIQAVEKRLGGRVDRLEAQLGERIDRLEQSLDEKTRVFIVTTIGAVFAAVLATAGIVAAGVI